MPGNSGNDGCREESGAAQTVASFAMGGEQDPLATAVPMKPGAPGGGPAPFWPNLCQHQHICGARQCVITVSDPEKAPCSRHSARHLSLDFNRRCTDEGKSPATLHWLAEAPPVKAPHLHKMMNGSSSGFSSPLSATRFPIMTSSPSL